VRTDERAIFVGMVLSGTTNVSDQPTIKPICNYRLRATKDGQWLWMLSVSKNGASVQVTNWSGVAAQSNQYDFHPQFISVQDSAWIGPLDSAEMFKHILSTRCGIQTEIVQWS
jgi:hypothetical protein